MYFLHMAQYRLLVLTNTRQHFGTTAATFKTVKSPTKKHKNVKNLALNRLKKALVYSRTAETGMQSVVWLNVTWGHLRMFVNDYESTLNIDFGVQINYNEEADSQVQNI